MLRGCKIYQNPTVEWVECESSKNGIVRESGGQGQRGRIRRVKAAKTRPSNTEIEQNLPKCDQRMPRVSERCQNVTVKC